MYNPLESLHVGDQERERVSGTGGGGGGDFGGLQVRVTFHGWSMDKKDYFGEHRYLFFFKGSLNLPFSETS